MNKIIMVAIAAVAVTSVLIYAYSMQAGEPDYSVLTTESKCTLYGGTMVTRMCCNSVGDLPNTCLIGACGCSPDNSHEVKVCDCGEGKCWDSEKKACV